MRLGWFRPVHCKSRAAQEVRALLTARKLIKDKLHDVEMSLRGILRGFGLKVGATTRRSYMLKDIGVSRFEIALADCGLQSVICRNQPGRAQGCVTKEASTAS